MIMYCRAERDLYGDNRVSEVQATTGIKPLSYIKRLQVGLYKTKL